MSDVKKWYPRFAATLGARFLPTTDPSAITSEYTRVTPSSLPRALLVDDKSDSQVRSIHRWLALTNNEHAAEHYVGEVFHAAACNVDDGGRAILLPREELTFPLGDSLKVVAAPHYTLAYAPASDAEELWYRAIVNADRMHEIGRLGWGELVGQMMAAAMVTNDNGWSGAAVTPVYGIRVVKTRWTFLRADFPTDYLHRLRAYKLQPSDGFDVRVWSGPELAADAPLEQLRWGLDFSVLAEREQILRMLVALGQEALQDDVRA